MAVINVSSAKAKSNKMIYCRPIVEITGNQWDKKVSYAPIIIYILVTLALLLGKNSDITDTPNCKIPPAAEKPITKAPALQISGEGYR